MTLNPLFKEHNSKNPLVIAGPCSAESLNQVMFTARALNDAGVRIFRAGIWKPRTRPCGFEGWGVKALPWLSMVKEMTGMLCSTEVGCARHVEMALEAGMDLLWIGARTTASPFAMEEIAQALRGCDVPVLVKNPVCPDLDLWIGAMERLHNAGLRRLGAIHRGFKTAGDTLYRNTPLWDIAGALRKELPELPILCDPSHMGGDRKLIEPLSVKALQLGYEGLIIESHICPDEAWTDARQQITPDELGTLMHRLNQRDHNHFYAVNERIN